MLLPSSLCLVQHPAGLYVVVAFMSVQSCLYYPVVLPNPPTFPWKPFFLRPWPLLSQPVSPTPLPPPSLPTPSPNPRLLEAPPGRLIDSVPGGGDHATFLNWLPLLQIKAPSLHPSAPLSISPCFLQLRLSNLQNIFFQFLFFPLILFFCGCLHDCQPQIQTFIDIWIHERTDTHIHTLRAQHPAFAHYGVHLQRASIFTTCTWGPQRVCLNVRVCACVFKSWASPH